MTTAPDLPSPTGPAPVVALVGNPRAGSRTATAAQRVAAQVATRLGPATPTVAVLELATVADQVLLPEAPAADGYRDLVTAARVVVVATPVYKASYTGLLKAFLDRFPAGALREVVAIPVTVSASPAHTFVAEHLLRPLLVELGASVPTSALGLVESQLPELDAVVDRWLTGAGPLLHACVRRP